MATGYQVPFYSRLSPKLKQRANLLAGGLAMLCVALLVSSFIGGPSGPTGPAAEPPKPRAVGGGPGSALDPRDAWMGGAGKDLANLQATVREQGNAQTALRGELEQTREILRAEIRALREGRPAGSRESPSGQGEGAGNAPGPISLPAAIPATPTEAARPPEGVPAARNAPQGFPPQPGPAARPAPGEFPPGSPQPSAFSNPSPRGFQPQVVAPVLMRVGATSAGQGSASAAADGEPTQAGRASAVQRAQRQVGSFLPVGFTRAVLLGGLAAPTGGQAQNNPVPVLLRLADLAELPNGFRGQVKDCLVVGEGFGDHSTERAYIRTTLLSCVMHDGQVLEAAIKGSVFGEDGMNGVMGSLVTKQGAILGNALMAGIAAGIGSGISQASQTISTTTLGPINSAPTDAEGILRQGVGTGVGKALDRLAQYYINLAERTFPAVEVQPGRVVDVVITQGVSLDIALAAYSPAGALTAGALRRGERQSMRHVLAGDVQED